MPKRFVSGLSSRLTAAALVAGATLVLAACGGGDSTTRGITSALMGPSGGGTADIVGERPPTEPGPACPQVTIREGTETLRIHERGREGDPASVRYQGSLIRVARECNYSGDANLAMRVGITGRLLTGPVGQPGNYELPLRAAFVRPGQPPTWTQIYRVPVTVLPGETSARFSFVIEDLQVVLPEGTGGGSYVVYVGFDERT